MKTYEITKAIKKWKNINWVFFNDMVEFAKFIGYPMSGEDGGLIVDTNKPEVVRIIEMINGENGALVLAILQVRHEKRINEDSNAGD